MSRWVIALLLVCCWGPTVSAQLRTPVLAQTRRAPAAPGGEGPAFTRREHREHRHDAEPFIEEEDETQPAIDFALDVVVGFGRVPAVTEIPARENADEVESRLEQARVTSESVVITGGYEFGHRVGIELRVPLAYGRIDPRGPMNRSVFALGNLELEGEYAILLSHDLQINFEVGVAVPTAQGQEVPEAAERRREPVSAGGQDALDQGAILRAAAASRGFEDEALFEVDRVGIVPKVSLDFHHGRWLLGPFLKLENLLYTGDEPGVKPLIELLLGGYAGVMLSHVFELRTRLWCDVVLEGQGSSVAIVEPQLAAHLHAFRFAIGGIVPVIGGLTDPRFGGLRALASLRI
ncbi:MAG: hypothetical protein ABW321_30740 [Polyangiales bacterium]